jgi:hypothetical protein
MMGIEENLEKLEELAKLTFEAEASVALTLGAKQLLHDAAGLIIQAADADRDYAFPSPNDDASNNL